MSANEAKKKSGGKYFHVYIHIFREASIILKNMCINSPEKYVTYIDLYREGPAEISTLLRKREICNLTI